MALHAATPVARGIVRSAIWDGRNTVRFRALNSPEMVTANKADFMSPKDYVLGVTMSGQSRAYPSAYIGFHHVVNDKMFTATQEPIWFAVTYCDMCGTGIVFSSLIDGKPRELEFYGLYNGTIALSDRETHSIFIPATGMFVTGALQGKSLQMGTVLDTTWAEWKRLHPDTKVMAPDESDRQYYSDTGKHQRAMDSFPMEFFAPTVTRADSRLKPFVRILGATVRIELAGGHEQVAHRAYTFDDLKRSGGVLDDQILDQPVTVLFDPETVTAVIVARRLEGRLLRLELRRDAKGARIFADRDSKMTWTIEGRSAHGTSSPHDLTRIDAYLGEWYSWSATFPDTSIYGSNAPPQPVRPAF